MPEAEGVREREPNMFEHEPDTAVAEPVVRTKNATKPKRQPRYHVILWNDDDHSFEYVIRMMKELFGHANEKGMQIAKSTRRAKPSA